eukprot:c40752_g1_i1 orf=2-178(-)
MNAKRATHHFFYGCFISFSVARTRLFREFVDSLVRCGIFIPSPSDSLHTSDLREEVSLL